VSSFSVDLRLLDTSYLVCDMPLSQIRLSKNALVPCVLIIPKTDKIEWFELDETMQIALNRQINSISGFLKHLGADKINVAMIGNVVSQMHIHVVARNIDDYCWPEVIWGKEAFLSYDEEQKEALIAQLQSFLNL
jgi:Diadenosine tetraphosphate (Ap4A) hydrolase and other HIT family hydrolases